MNTMYASKRMRRDAIAAMSSKPDDIFPENEPQGAALAAPEVKTKALELQARVKLIAVHDQATLDAANDFLHDIDVMLGQIDKTFNPQIAKAHDLHKSLLAEKKKFTEPLELAKKVVGQRIAVHVTALLEKRREAERARLAAEDEARRLAEKTVEKVRDLEANGEEGKAARMVERVHDQVNKIIEAAPEIPDEAATAGLVIREDWKFSIVDASLIPREYLVPDEKKIGRIVRALKGDANIPGVRAYAVKSTVVRSAAEADVRD
jgi:hypothetical protein